LGRLQQAIIDLVSMVRHRRANRCGSNHADAGLASPEFALRGLDFTLGQALQFIQSGWNIHALVKEAANDGRVLVVHLERDVPMRNKMY
jgi:hypothetical protein